MAVTVVVDTPPSAISGSKRDGAWVRVRRRVLVTGLTDGDPDVLDSALDALDGEGLTDGSLLSGTNDLILRQRDPTVMKDSPGVVEVTLTYEHFMSGGQRLDSPAHGNVYYESSTSLQEITTNRYPDMLHVPAADRGKLIEVKHTFPDGTNAYQDNDGNTLAADPDYPGVQITQVGEVSVPVPIETVRVTGIGETDHPGRVKADMERHVNENAWLGRPARKWLCTSVVWEPWDFDGGASPAKYRFAFEFQGWDAGWDPDVVFVDKRTGQPPPGLVQNVGYISLWYHPATDFRRYLDVLEP